MRREVATGLSLGVILATLGLARILGGHAFFGSYGAHYGHVAASVALSLLGVVSWGTVMGSMLPFAVRRAGFDPAIASAPLVATLVDVSGLLIYFNVAKLMMQGGVS